MGMDIIGKNNEVHFNWNGWRFVLDLAIQYGWEPDEKADYFTNSGQTLTAQDRNNISQALQKGLNKEGTEMHPIIKRKVKEFVHICNDGVFHLW